MRLEVSHCHFATRHEGGDSGKQSQANEEPAAELNDAGRQTFRVVDLTLSSQDSEQFLGAMTGKQRASYHAQNRVEIDFVTREKVCHRCPVLTGTEPTGKPRLNYSGNRSGRPAIRCAQGAPPMHRRERSFVEIRIMR